MSDDPSRIKDIDLEIFKDGHSQCLKPQKKDDGALITELCSHCKRLCAASRYYDVLSGSKMDEEKKKALLVEFMETVYRSVLDDTAHFIKEHSEDLQQVWSEWTEQYGFAKCSVSHCAKTARHYGRGRRDRKKERESGKEEDALYAFYESLFDRFHNYLAHLFQIGLRVDTASLTATESKGGDEKEGDLEGQTVDTLFAAERDQIKSQRKECGLDLDRLDDQNNKFTIQTADKLTERTLTDAVLEKVAEIQEVDHEQVGRLRAYLKRNRFDSDGVEADLEDAADSNIGCLVESPLVVQVMSSFIRSIKCTQCFCLCSPRTLESIQYLALSLPLHTQCDAKHFPPDLSLNIGPAVTQCPLQRDTKISRKRS